MKIDTIIIPGYTNSGPQHWQTLWEQKHPGYKRVQQKDRDHPTVNQWVAELNRKVNESISPVVFIAHSLGCLTIAHWAGRFKGNVLGAFLVAPPDVEGNNCPEEIKNFAPVPF